MMTKDVFQTPGHVFCFQEAEEGFCKELMVPRKNPPDEKIRNRGTMSRPEGAEKMEQKWLVVRGVEREKTTAVAARSWPFKGIRRECFILGDGGSKGQTDYFNRTLFATLKFSKKIWGTGESDDELGGMLCTLASRVCHRCKPTRWNLSQSFLG